MFLSCGDREDSDQTGRMPRLIWVFNGHTGNFVGFVKRRLNLCVSGFSSGKTRYGRSPLLFYFTKLFYIDIAFSTFSPIL